MHGAVFWLLVFIVYYIAAWLWSVWSWRECNWWSRRVLTSWQIWLWLRFIAWLTIGFLAGSAFVALIAAFIFWILEIFFDWVFGDGCCAGGWCGRPNRCGPPRPRHVCNDECRDECAWRNGWGQSTFFWRRIFTDFIVMLLGAFIGAALFPNFYLADFVYAGSYGYAIGFWIWAFVVAVILTLLYRWAVCRITCGWTTRILLDPRTLLLIQAAYFLFLGMFSGAPAYVAFLWLILWEIIDAILGCCFYEFREPWFKTLEAFVYAPLAFLIGAELLRPLLCQNMYPYYYFYNNTY